MRVTFHKHEVEGARIAARKTDAWGLSAPMCADIAVLVEMHQIRCDPKKTKTKTYRKIVRKLGGEGNIRLLIQVMMSDRMGNDKNRGKPDQTYFMTYLRDRLYALALDTVTYDKIPYQIIESLVGTKDWELIHTIRERLALIVQNNPKRNNQQFITEFVRKNYLEKKNDNSKGIPHW